LTRYFQETHPPAFRRGTGDFARYYGMTIDGLQMEYVQGFGYNQVLPAPEAELPERFERAERVFAQKLWREQLREWDQICKPAARISWAAGLPASACFRRSISAEPPADTSAEPRISPSNSDAGSPVQSPTWARKSPVGSTAPAVKRMC